MLQQLKLHFQEALVVPPTQNENQYEWFCTKEGETFGISKKSTLDRERKLLSTIFNLKNLENAIDVDNNDWTRLLFDGDLENVRIKIPTKIRFVHFYIKQLDEKEFFVETLHSLFTKTIIIIWKNQNEGVIIEQDIPQCIESLHYTINALIGDFITDIIFYVGDIHCDISNAKNLRKNYLEENKSFLIAKKLNAKNLYCHSEMLPFLLLLNAGSHELINSNLEKYIKYCDAETIKSLQVYFERNMNISDAAKKLYMHRNSLQYRIDKFVEATGLDIRNFAEAVTVYLTICFIKMKENGEVNNVDSTHTYI